MKKTVASFIAGTLIFIAVTAFGMGKVDKKVEGAIDFTLPDLSGRMVSLADKRGKIVLLNFWATWCPPCRKEIPSMERLHRKFGGDSFEIIAVATDRKGAAIVKPFIDEKGATFTVLIDSDDKVSAMYDAYALPTTFIIGKDGVVLDKVTGMADWFSEESQKYFEELIKRK